jgi:hypothetical protein
MLTVIVHTATHAGAAEQQAQHEHGFTALSVDAAATILAYAGGNNWLGNATVCTGWKDTYTAVNTSRRSSNSSSSSCRAVTHYTAQTLLQPLLHTAGYQ